MAQMVLMTMTQILHGARFIKCEMKRWDKDGRVWYSHKADGEWCNGK